MHLLMSYASQPRVLNASGSTNPTISEIKKKKGDTHEFLPSDVAVAIVIEIRREMREECD